MPVPAVAVNPREPRLSYEESYRGLPEKPAETLETARRKLLEKAIRNGYCPAEDILAFAKQEEMQAFDRLARWQAKQGAPLTVEPIPPGKDREFLAAFGALQERRHYYANRPIERLKMVRWVHEDWELDPESEAELLRQVYARIEGKLRIPSVKT